jgi:hypothetical protein
MSGGGPALKTARTDEKMRYDMLCGEQRGTDFGIVLRKA